MLTAIYLRSDRVTPEGQPIWDEYTLSTPFRTWIDFTISRVAEQFRRDTDVQGTWEVRRWIQDQVTALAGRPLRTGDKVEFSTRHEVFVLGEYTDDSGLFGGVSFQKFNIRRSDA